ALKPLPIAAAVPLLEAHGDGVRAAVELEPYGDWWVVADLSAGMRPGRPLPLDHVLGVGGASTTLAGATLRHKVNTAHHLGPGGGVRPLHLPPLPRRVPPPALPPRRLFLPGPPPGLNHPDGVFLRGTLAEPVQNRRFDLVVSNPPFIVGPGVQRYD